jgi:hypothetical protein
LIQVAALDQAMPQAMRRGAAHVRAAWDPAVDRERQRRVADIVNRWMKRHHR